MHSRFLRPEDIRRLGSYEYEVRTVVEGHLAGRHRARSRGASTEFLDFRPYVPGDSPDLIDWKVLARTDKHFVRLFEQETHVEVHLLVDSSASMGFRSGAARTKLEYASFFAACLAWLVTSRHDRVSLTTFDTGVRRAIPPGASRRHLHTILDTLERNEPGKPTRLGDTLLRCAPLLKHKGSLVVLSDFYEDPQQLFRALNPYLHRGFKVHLLHLLDPAEIDLPERGPSRFVDPETGEKLDGHTAQLRDAYRTEVLEHSRSLRRLAASRGVDYALTATDTDFFTLLDRLVLKR